LTAELSCTLGCDEDGIDSGVPGGVDEPADPADLSSRTGCDSGGSELTPGADEPSLAFVSCALGSAVDVFAPAAGGSCEGEATSRFQVFPPGGLFALGAGVGARTPGARF